MGERFRKEAGFRYRVDGNVVLHYMNGDRDECREEDEPALFEDYETLAAALNEARAYVSCEGAHNRIDECDGKPFEVTVARSGIGSFEERVAEVVRVGLAADPDDPEDEGEWDPCDARGTFWDEDGYGEYVIECLRGGPGQVREAWDRAKREYWDYLDYKSGWYRDIAETLGFVGEGCYSFKPCGEDGLPIGAEKAPAVRIDGKQDFLDCFTHASLRANNGEVIVEWHGDEASPDEDVDEDWGRIAEGMDFLWEMLKKGPVGREGEANRPALRSDVYRTVEPGWSERRCWEDLPVEKLEVSLKWTDDDGEESSDSESMTVPDGWDGTDPTDYERLGRELCERNDVEYSDELWKD